jgi:prophage antirepressor-like protein
MHGLQIFEHEEFGSICVVEVDGSPWFVGKDVAEKLGYSNLNEAISDHVDA